MAFKVIHSRRGIFSPFSLKAFICDSADDLNNLPRFGVLGKQDNDPISVCACAYGSTALVCNGSITETYILTPNNEWTKMSQSGGSPEDDPDTPTDTIAPGLYQTGTIALYEEQGASAAEGMLVKSWEDMVDSGAIVVEEGVISTPRYPSSELVVDNLPEINEYGFYYDTKYTAFMQSGFASIAFHNDGSFDMYTNGVLVESAPVGTAVYSDKSIDLSAYSYGVGIVSEDGAIIDLSSVLGMVFNLGAPFTLVGDLILPEDSSITTIGERGFAEKPLVNVLIPNTITDIGNTAFYNCTALKSVRIPNSVTSIGDYVFQNCYELTSISIPDSVTSIGEHAFYKCSALTSITIPNSVTSIGGWAFEYCTALTSVTIPSSVISIGESAFCFCEGLTSISIPNSVTSIGGWAFKYCTALESVTIPDSITSIDADTFGYCTALTSVTIPDSVTSIGDNAFSGCSSLTSIDIPDSVTSIGKSAFSGCSNLIQKDNNISYVDNWVVGCNTSATSATLRENTVGIANYTFEECNKLKNITIPEGVLYIGRNAFENCWELTHVVIPHGVTTIRYEAFYGADPESITIPSSVTTIEDRAFYGCDVDNYMLIFDGTVAQWNAVSLGDSWRFNSDINRVQCSDGQVSL